MHLDSFLAQAFIYLLAAVISVPVAKRLGLGAVLGYLLAGVVIGPSVAGFVGAEGGDVMHFAEFGVVMMMFAIGLELKPSLLWRLRGPILGMGGAQVLGTAAVVAAAAYAIGMPWKASVATGLILAMSSTAIVLQTLVERGVIKSEAGKSAFAVLLFQDIAVIPIIALLPLLAIHGASAPVPGHEHGHGPELAGWQNALLTLGAVALIVGGGRFVVRPIFRYIARTKLHEIFTATALLLVVGIALLMQSVGLSPALGTFLAGVMLSESEFRHELESDIEPFKGLLLGIFFIAVGAGLDLAFVAAQPGMIFSWVAALILLKMLVLYIIARVTKMQGSDRSLFTCALAQGGEFCFVLLSLAQSGGVLPLPLIKPLSAVVAITMALTPLMFLAHEKILLPRLQRKENEREMDEIEDEENPVIIAGFGRFGIMVGRMMKAQGIGNTVLDLDSDQVDFLRKLGINLFYGDASRLDLLRAAGAEKARIFVLAIDDKDKALDIVDTVKKHFPHLTILARAEDRIHAYQLLQKGVKHIFRETFGSSLDMSYAALRELGMPAHEAHFAVRAMRDFDEEGVRRMAPIWKEHTVDGQGYITAARLQLEEMDRLFKSDAREDGSPERAWSTESLRNEVLGRRKNGS